MAKYHGKDSFFSIDADNLTAYLTDIGFPQPVDVAETSTMGTESKTYIAGMGDGTISLTGRWDDTVTTGPDHVLSALRDAKLAVQFVYGPGGNTSGKVTYTGDCIITSYDKTSPIGDVVGFAVTAQVTGDVTRAVVV